MFYFGSLTSSRLTCWNVLFIARGLRVRLEVQDSAAIKTLESNDFSTSRKGGLSSTLSERSCENERTSCAHSYDHYRCSVVLRPLMPCTLFGLPKLKWMRGRSFWQKMESIPLVRVGGIGILYTGICKRQRDSRRPRKPY